MTKPNTALKDIENMLAMMAVAYIGAVANDNREQADQAIKTTAKEILALIQDNQEYEFEEVEGHTGDPTRPHSILPSRCWCAKPLEEEKTL